MNDLFIGGGGVSGVVFIGCLEYIHENKLLDLKNFYGCSIGSLIGCLYISGNTPKNMLSKFLELDLADIVKYNFNNIMTKNFIVNDSLLDNLIGLLWDSINENITIKEFCDNYNVNVNIYATNISKDKYTNFNNVDYPNVKLKDALKASMTIPFFFKPVVINGDTYVDGCCKNLYGSPPQDVYICGYSIISHAGCMNESYGAQLMTAMCYKSIPRSTFIIDSYYKLDSNIYLNLDSFDGKIIIDMYKKGIYIAKYILQN